SRLIRGSFVQRASHKGIPQRPFSYRRCDARGSLVSETAAYPKWTAGNCVVLLSGTAKFARPSSFPSQVTEVPMKAEKSGIPITDLIRTLRTKLGFTDQSGFLLRYAFVLFLLHLPRDLFRRRLLLV